jgi:hypothetical protein
MGIGTTAFNVRTVTNIGGGPARDQTAPRTHRMCQQAEFINKLWTSDTHVKSSILTAYITAQQSPKTYISATL